LCLKVYNILFKNRFAEDTVLTLVPVPEIIFSNFFTMIEFYNDYIISYHYYQNHPSLLPSSFHFELHFSKKKRKEKKKKGIHILRQCGNIYVYNLVSNFSCLIIKM